MEVKRPHLQIDISPPAEAIYFYYSRIRLRIATKEGPVRQ